MYNISFSGKIKEGVDLNTVKTNIAKIFKYNQKQVESLFSGKTIVLKKGVDKETAQKYHQAYTKSGAILEIKQASLQQDSTPAKDNQERNEIKKEAQTLQKEIVPAAKLEQQATVSVSINEVKPIMKNNEPTEASRLKRLEIQANDEYKAAFANVDAPDFGFSNTESLAEIKEVVVEELDLSNFHLGNAGDTIPELKREEEKIELDLNKFKLAS